MLERFSAEHPRLWRSLACGVSGVFVVIGVLNVVAAGVGAVWLYHHSTRFHGVADTVGTGLKWLAIGCVCLCVIVWVLTGIFKVVEWFMDRWPMWQVAWEDAEPMFLLPSSQQSRKGLFKGLEWLLLSLGISTVEGVLLGLWAAQNLNHSFCDGVGGVSLASNLVTGVIIQFIMTGLGMMLWQMIDKRSIPTFGTRWSAAYLASLLPLWGLQIHGIAAEPVWRNPLGGLIGGILAAAFLLGAAFSCERNLFDILRGKPKPVHSHGGEV